MFKSRPLSAQPVVLANPRIDFDYKELAKAARLFLGKEKADILLKAAFQKENPEKTEGSEPAPDPQNEKAFLLLLAHMEYAARWYRSNPKEEARWNPEDEKSKESDEADAPYKSAPTRGKDARFTRNAYVQDFLGAITLRSEKSFRLNMAHRIRSQAQREALLWSRPDIVRNPNDKENPYKLRLLISTSDLPKLSAALDSEDKTLKIDTYGLGMTPNKEMPVEIVWTDELPQRPEVARQVLGRQTRNLMENGRSSLSAIGKERRGAQIVLIGGQNCKATFKKSRANVVEIALEPQVEIKPGGLQAFDNETALMDYLAEQYSCSPQEFFEAIPEIIPALEDNLEQATRIWNNIPENKEVTEDDKNKFLTEYTETCLTLHNTPNPPGSISLRRLEAWDEISQSGDNKSEPQRIKAIKDLVEELHTSLNPELQNFPGLESAFLGMLDRVQEETFGRTQLNRVSLTPSKTGLVEKSHRDLGMISTINPAAGISRSWKENILTEVIENMVNPPQGDGNSHERAMKSLENTAAALNVTTEELMRRRRLALEAFYRVGKGLHMESNPHDRASFLTYSLSEEDRRRFFEELDAYNQKDFDSKGDAPLGADGKEMAKPDLESFIRRGDASPVEIPLNPISLHRLTRYPTSTRNMKDVTRPAYGNPKHLPRDRGQKNNNLQALELADFLTPEALAEAQKAIKEVELNPNSPESNQVQTVVKTLALWNRGFGLILPTRPSNPIDARALAWVNDLLLAKRSGRSSGNKCQSFKELFNLVTSLTRLAGMKVGGVDTPLQTQPMPSMSSNLPLKLLCGVSPNLIPELRHCYLKSQIEDLENQKAEVLKAGGKGAPKISAEIAALEKELEETPPVHLDPVALRDLQMRWENSIRGNLEMEPDLAPEEAQLHNLLEADPDRRMETIAASLLTKEPNHQKEFYEKLGLNGGFMGLDPEVRLYTPALPRIKTSPVTIRIKGEEMNIHSLTSEVVKNMEPQVANEFQTFTPEESLRLENAQQRHLATYRESLVTKAERMESLRQESRPLHPKGKESLLLLNPDDENRDIEGISEGLSDAISAAQSQEEASGQLSKKWVQTIAKALTNPDVEEIRIGGFMTLVKHGGSHVEIRHELALKQSEGKEAQISRWNNLALETLNFLRGEEHQLSPEDTKVAQVVLTDALNREISENAVEILETLKSVPQDALAAGLNEKSSPDTNAILAKSSLERVCHQAQLEKALLFQIQNWGNFDDTHSGSIESTQIVFDFQHELETLCKKVWGSPKDTREDEEIKAAFLAATGEKAREIFLHEGEEPTREFMAENARSIFQEHRERLVRASAEPLAEVCAHLQDLAHTISPDGELTEHAPAKAKKATIAEGILHTICHVSEISIIVAEKLQKAIAKTEAIALDRGKDEPKPKAILPHAIARGSQTPIKIHCIDGQLSTNKIWAQDVLNSDDSQTLIRQSQLASQWASKGESRRQSLERAAFLTYLQSQNLGEKAALILASGDTKALESGLERFTDALTRLKVDTTKSSALCAGICALHQVDPEVLLGPEVTTALENALPEETAKMALKVKFEPVVSKGTTLPSPFLPEEDYKEAKAQMENRSDRLSTGTRIQEIRKAGDALREKEVASLER
jgi:hypothetical protein